MHHFNVSAFFLLILSLACYCESVWSYQPRPPHSHQHNSQRHAQFRPSQPRHIYAQSRPQSEQAHSKPSYSYDPSTKNYNSMCITSLYRYAVKGLSGDSLNCVQLNEGDGTFEDDRRFALLFDNGERVKFDKATPTWLHKENFLGAFTASELLATLDTEYRVETHSSEVKRILTVWDRTLGRSSPPLLQSNLTTPEGRENTEKYFTDLCGRNVQCVTADETSSLVKPKSQHTHQFGNTSSGVKNNNGDTRTIHIINSNTVKDFSKRICPERKDDYLSSTRFRPNMIIDNLDPWAEFDLIGKTIQLVKDGEIDSSSEHSPPLQLRIVSRTVRCAGVGLDALKPEERALDIPKLLLEHFPEHGPYLGVYAVVEKKSFRGCFGNEICVNDTFRVVDN